MQQIPNKSSGRVYVGLAQVGGRMIIPVEGHYGFQDLYQASSRCNEKVYPWFV
jgi:hypothetical protein